MFVSLRRSVAVLVLVSAPAQAEFLPDSPRAIPLAESASRDAPVFEYAYGPRAQLSIGGEVGLYFRHGPKVDFRLSVFGLVALENGTSFDDPVPEELFRLLFGVTLAWARPAPRWLGQRGVLEFSLGVAREQASTLGGYEVPEGIPNAIAFGGGGTFIDPAIAWQAPFGPIDLTIRVDVRLHLPGLLLVFDQRSLADVVADITSDGLTNEPAFEAIVRWRVAERWQPVISAHADLQFPVDASSSTGYFVRALGGVAFRTGRGELIPFVSGDVGNGLGLLIDRQERRFSVGVRYAFL